MARRKMGVGTNKKTFTGIYELGVYPKKKPSPNGSNLFAYLVPTNPEKNKRIYKLNNVKEVVVYENGKLIDRYRGNLPARTVRMNNAMCEYDKDSMKLICQTDDIYYLKKRGKLAKERELAQERSSRKRRRSRD